LSAAYNNKILKQISAYINKGIEKAHIVDIDLQIRAFVMRFRIKLGFKVYDQIHKELNWEVDPETGNYVRCV
jgi:hypothetical protein